MAVCYWLQDSRDNKELKNFLFFLFSWRTYKIEPTTLIILVILALGLLIAAVLSGEIMIGIAAGIIFLIIGFGIFATDLEFKSGLNRTYIINDQNVTVGEVEENIYSNPSNLQTNAFALLLTVLGVGLVGVFAWFSRW